MTGLYIPELDELRELLGDEAAFKVARAPGGWRSLSKQELRKLELSAEERDAILALQRLAVRRTFPCLAVGALATPGAVAEAYQAWFGSLEQEVVMALALDGQNRLIQELEVARGGLHGAALTPRDVFLPLIRAGATSVILAHNHPSGDPTPSREDLAMTRAVAMVGDIVGIQLLDHFVFASGDGGFTSMFELGLLQPQERRDEQDHPAETLPA